MTESDSLVTDRLDEFAKPFHLPNLDVLRDVITDLYKDPANSLIRFSAIIYIARDKLDGVNIEEELRRSRQYDRVITPITK